MIKQAIYEFLTSDGTLTHATREAARQQVRRLLGTEIYDARRPAGTADLALTLTRGGGQVLTGLEAPVACAVPVIDFTLWSRDRAGHEGDAERAYVNLVILLNQYRGPLNADVTSQTFQLEAEAFERPIAPNDGTDRWRRRLSFSFLVPHNVVAAIAPVTVGGGSGEPPSGIGSWKIGSTFVVR